MEGRVEIIRPEDALTAERARIERALSVSKRLLKFCLLSATAALGVVISLTLLIPVFESITASAFLAERLSNILYPMLVAILTYVAVGAAAYALGRSKLEGDANQYNREAQLFERSEQATRVR